MEKISEERAKELMSNENLTGITENVHGELGISYDDELDLLWFIPELLAQECLDNRSELCSLRSQVKAMQEAENGVRWLNLSMFDTIAANTDGRRSWYKATEGVK